MRPASAQHAALYPRPSIDDGGGCRRCNVSTSSVLHEGLASANHSAPVEPGPAAVMVTLNGAVIALGRWIKASTLIAMYVKPATYSSLTSSSSCCSPSQTTHGERILAHAASIENKAMAMPPATAHGSRYEA